MATAFVTSTHSGKVTGAIETDRVIALIEDMEADLPPSRDLGRFSTTQFDETAINLMVAGSLRSQPCIEEYPSLADFREKCVSILANLWNAPSGFFGAATTGSSEAVLLGGLAMKRQWQLKPPACLNSPPNIIIGANAHICVNKFADYFDVEARIIHVSEKSGYAFDVEALGDHLDGNTIGVFLTLGCLPTLDIMIQSNTLQTCWMSTSFAQETISPSTDFRLPRVRSINVSGHKFGMAPLAVGWIVWRENSQIPQGLLLESSYLRGTLSNFSLSFSRSGAPVAAQYYYNFLRLGLAGYQDRTRSLLDRAGRFSVLLEHTGHFLCLSDAHRQQTSGACQTLCRGHDQPATPVLPIVVFKLTDRVRRQYPKLQLSDVSDAMLDLKVSIPNYTFRGWGANGEDYEAMRIVLRDEMTTELMEEVLAGITQAVERLMDQVSMG
ncbi:hypothetical protein N7508_007217 [Penicillium antarcticum]|uniref:uncharacterized protein n=1 Tax=Penicillium antarcticum TaxID=416450 RepID=UPI002391BCD7|nr:uncharacterized protein N7508_007217 [Penicillium antarcticum]KAJ5302354.1 hypothetical protein N7508_007217 [Penicillium antarcticum]